MAVRNAEPEMTATPGQTITGGSCAVFCPAGADLAYPDALFPVWRYHPLVTNSELLTTEADITHRKHAIVETTFADLIDGPLADIPPPGCSPRTAPGWPAG